MNTNTSHTWHIPTGTPFQKPHPWRQTEQARCNFQNHPSSLALTFIVVTHTVFALTLHADFFFFACFNVMNVNLGDGGVLGAVDGPGRRQWLAASVEVWGDSFSAGKAVVTPASLKCPSDPVLWLLLVSVRSLASSLLWIKKRRGEKNTWCWWKTQDSKALQANGNHQHCFPEDDPWRKLPRGTLVWNEASVWQSDCSVL